jgi:hypothetical protein
LVFDQKRAYVGYANAASAPGSTNILMVNEMVGIVLEMDQSNETRMMSCDTPFESTIYINESVPSPPASTMEPTGTGSTEAPSSAAATHHGPQWTMMMMMIGLCTTASMLFLSM